MANSLDRDISNCEVVIAREHYKDTGDDKYNDEQNRTVFVTGGFGASAHTNGNALIVRGKDGKSFRAEGWMVEKFVREVPKEEREIAYIVNVMSPEGVHTYDVMAETTTSATHKVLDELGWANLPRHIGLQDDHTYIEVDGVEYAISPKIKGVTS